MASDSFTDVTGTDLGSHTAEGITWAAMGFAEPQGEIDSNMAGGGTEFFNVAVRASNLTGSYSQIVFKGGTYGAESKGIHVRAGASSQGYNILAAELTGDTITHLYLRKEDGFLAAATVSISRLVDHTVAIKATTVGSDVELRGWLDGAPLTWSSTAAGNEIPGEVFTDVAADTPILSGNPAFSYPFGSGFDQASSRFDNFTDVEPTDAAVLSSPTPSGTIGTQTTATIGATTNQATGNFYVVVDTSGNLAGVTASQIKAGQNAGGGAAFKSGDVAVSGANPSVGVTGLVASTSYAYAAIQNNANGDSNIVTGTFTTASAVAASSTPGGMRSRIATLMMT